MIKDVRRKGVSGNEVAIEPQQNSTTYPTPPQFRETEARRVGQQGMMENVQPSALPNVTECGIGKIRKAAH